MGSTKVDGSAGWNNALALNGGVAGVPPSALAPSEAAPAAPSPSLGDSGFSSAASRPGISPEAAARTDAQRVRTIATQDPDAAGQLVTELLAGNPDPAYAAELRAQTGSVPAGLSSARTAASAAVRVDAGDVGHTRAQLLMQGEATAVNANARADALFAEANANPSDPDFQRGSDSVTRLQRDGLGRVSTVDHAQREGANVTASATTLADDGAALRQTQGVVNGRAFTREERFATDGSGELPSPEDVRAQAGVDPSVQVDEQSVHQQGDVTHLHLLSAGPDGTTSVQRRYSTQAGTDGVLPALAGKLDPDDDVNVVDSSVAFHGAGMAPGSGTRISSTEYSQGNVRLTANRGLAPMDGGAGRTHWALEHQSGNAYARQDFVEGNPAFTSVLRRTASGNVVSDDVRSQYANDEGELVHTRGSARRTFAPDGGIAELSQDNLGADGTRLQLGYQRTLTDHPEGALMSERVNGQQLSANGELAGRTEDTEDSLLTEQGFAPVRASYGLSTPTGSTLTQSDENGSRTQVNGQPVRNADDYQSLDHDSQALMLQNGARGAHAVKDFVNSAGKATAMVRQSNVLAPSEKGWQAAARRGSNRMVDGMSHLTGGSVKRSLDTIDYTGGGLRTGAGLVGLGIGTSSLLHDLHRHNAVDLTYDGLTIAGSGINTYKGLRTVVKTLRGANKWAADAKSASQLGEIAANSGKVAKAVGTFGKVGGALTLVGVAAGGTQMIRGLKDHDKTETALGGISVASSLGAGMAAGSIGGPVGAIAALGIGLVGMGVSRMIAHHHRHKLEMEQKHEQHEERELGSQTADVQV